MLISRKCPYTGKINDREIKVTVDEIRRWQHGTLIQDAMPNVSAEDREFIMTGITPEAWLQYIDRKPANDA